MNFDLKNFPYDYGTAVSTPIAKENNRSFSLDNQSGYSIKRWSIEKVIFKDIDKERCDYLIEVSMPTKPKYYWVELKGKNIVKACRQILNTFERIIVSEPASHEARIITSGTNKIDIRSKEFVRLDNLMRKYQGRLKCGTNEIIEII